MNNINTFIQFVDEDRKNINESKTPYGYWTFDKCKEEGLKYTTRSELQKQSLGAYTAARRNGWMDKICSHMVSPLTPTGYWTKKKCQEEALKYTTRSKFHKNSEGAYISALRNNWLDEICNHMVSPQKPKKYWTKEKCQEEALKYDNKSDFFKNSVSAYVIARKNGWFDEICSHMVVGRRSFDSWTYEECKKEALKYNTRFDFRIGSYGAFVASRMNDWYEEICSHMGQFRNEYIGYAYEFEDNCVYVGITSREQKRMKAHSKDDVSAVFKHIVSTGLKPIRKLLFPPTESGEASELEKWWVEDYKKRGWTILNIANAGSLGGSAIKWTKEKCREEALKYNTRGEFCKNSASAYGVVLKNDWLDELCSHMTEGKKPNGYWNYNKCKEEALKYETRGEFRENSIRAYSSARENGWLDELCFHMTALYKPDGYWTKERCQEEALKYDTKSEFKQKSAVAYSIARTNGWIVEICSHMENKYGVRGYWNDFEKCKEAAIGCKTRMEFSERYGAAYTNSRKNGWLDEICSHMKEIKKPKGFWTKEKCKEESSKYKTRSEFYKNSSMAYVISTKNKWLDEFFPKTK